MRRGPPSGGLRFSLPLRHPSPPGFAARVDAGGRADAEHSQAHRRERVRAVVYASSLVLLLICHACVHRHPELPVCCRSAPDLAVGSNTANPAQRMVLQRLRQHSDLLPVPGRDPGAPVFSSRIASCRDCLQLHLLCASPCSLAPSSLANTPQWCWWRWRRRRCCCCCCCCCCRGRSSRFQRDTKGRGPSHRQVLQTSVTDKCCRKMFRAICGHLCPPGPELTQTVPPRRCSLGCTCTTPRSTATTGNSDTAFALCVFPLPFVGLIQRLWRCGLSSGKMEWVNGPEHLNMATYMKDAG